MNYFDFPGLVFRSAYRLALRGRWIRTKPFCSFFGRKTGQIAETIQQICVINLDRQPLRWRRMQEELEQICDSSGKPVIELTRRFSAIDAKDHARGLPTESLIETSYSLADQLYVDPQPAVSKIRINVNQRIQMTRQEVAVALSHIEVWKSIASGDTDFTLVLEDDVVFNYNFAKFVKRAWQDLKDAHKFSPPFDLLYLSYKEVKTGAQKSDLSDFVFMPHRGLWYLSGYVLSKSGARTLLSLLPVRGPVDLWINHQFKKLKVFATSKSVIKQRLDSRSSNSYSILPVLSKIGVLTKEKASLFEARLARKPVFAFGEAGTGLTSLAMALSMLGYRCCSDVKELPVTEHEKLFGKRQRRIFDAYVNVGSLEQDFVELSKLYPQAVFIVTMNTDASLPKLTGEIPRGLEASNDEESLFDIQSLVRRLMQSSDNVLILPTTAIDKWKLLCEFLQCVPPTSRYPALVDLRQRPPSPRHNGNRKDFPRAQRLKFDSSPWIAISDRNWSGLPTVGNNRDAIPSEGLRIISDKFRKFDSSFWELRNDTFPSNLALFDPSNFSITDRGAILRLQRKRSGVRNYTGTSICSRQIFLYGRFEAEIRPSNVAGVITGVFLHRNSPRQEIDIEFLGKDTTKLLVNVYYNPGIDGAMFDYGYRGTPFIIHLDFDASEDFHLYTIEWSSTSIRWFVDNQLVHERFNWGPTPIPHLPMQFYVNLWPSRSVELAGRLLDRKLPTSSAIRAVHLEVF